jgi:hypothetical protein
MGLVLHAEPASPALVPSRSDRPAVLAAAAGDAKSAQVSKPANSRNIPERSEPVEFVRDIKPLLERSCVTCHSGETPEGGFTVTDRGALLRGGESGDAAVAPGKSGASPLFDRASSDDPDFAMPPQAKRDKFPALSDVELAAVRAWIDSGAAWPDGVTLKVEAK